MVEWEWEREKRKRGGRKAKGGGGAGKGKEGEDIPRWLVLGVISDHATAWPPPLHR